MNLFPSLKNKQTGQFSLGDAMPPQPSLPEDDLTGLEPLAAMLNNLRRLNEDYQRAIAALGAARRQQQGWDAQSEPDLTWSVRREVISMSGDAAALAQFDREHGADLAAEQEARRQATQKALELPARIKALETYIKELAHRMEAEIQEEKMCAEIELMFVPSAQRMMVAAQTFVQAWREMCTVDMVLKSVLRISHVSLYGDSYSANYAVELLSRREGDQFLPLLVHGLSFEAIQELNHAFDETDAELANRLRARLRGAGIDGGSLKIVHPGAENDPRKIYAPEGAGPAKRPDPFPYGQAEIVTFVS